MNRLQQQIATNPTISDYRIFDLRDHVYDTISDDGRIGLPHGFMHVLIQAGDTTIMLNKDTSADAYVFTNADRPDKRVVLPTSEIQTARGVILGRVGLAAELDFDMTASRSHFAFSVDQDGVQIADISMNGTLVAVAPEEASMAFTRQPSA